MCKQPKYTSIMHWLLYSLNKVKFEIENTFIVACGESAQTPFKNLSILRVVALGETL